MEARLGNSSVDRWISFLKSYLSRLDQNKRLSILNAGLIKGNQGPYQLTLWLPESFARRFVEGSGGQYVELIKQCTITLGLTKKPPNNFVAVNILAKDVRRFFLHSSLLVCSHRDMKSGVDVCAQYDVIQRCYRCKQRKNGILPSEGWGRKSEGKRL